MSRRARSPQAALFASLPPALQAKNPQLGVLARARIEAAPPAERAEVERVVRAQDLHARQGAHAHAAGEGWEAWLCAQHTLSVTAGLVAWVEKVGAPTQPHLAGGRAQFDARGRLVSVVTGTAPPDYLGVLADGRGLVVEAKRRSGRLVRDRERPDGSEDRAGIAQHQRELLDRAHRVGALALVVVEFLRAEGPVRCAVPWGELASRWTSVRGGALSVGPDELADWRIADGELYLARFVRARGGGR